MLEIIERGVGTQKHTTPLLFVHGAWQAAWCWDVHFLDFFANCGYRALALSLRGHGRSSTVKPLHDCSIADYTEDVASVVDTLPTPPAVIGHSMGGYVVQKYLEHHQPPAAVLLASLPPSGLRSSAPRMLKRYPWPTLKSLMTGDTTTLLAKPKRAREVLFTPETPEALVVGYLSQFGEESRRVIQRDLMNRQPPTAPSSENSCPVLVFGSDIDMTVSIADNNTTARRYRTRAHIIEGLGHEMMLDPEWRQAANHIHRWLVDHNI